MSEKKLTWFRKHWILSIILSIFILGGIASIFVEEETQDTNEDSRLSLVNSVSKIWKDLDGMTLNQKLNECTELCAGKDLDIPLIKNECYSSCYQIYYNLGEKELDIYLKELRGTK